MTEIEVLRVICWIGLGSSVVAMLFTILPLLRANGTRPILIVLSMTSILMFIGAIFLALITYAIDQVNSTGIAEVGVFYIRIKPILVSAALIWLGWRLRAKPHQMVAGPAVMTIPVTITQEQVDEQQ